MGGNVVSLIIRLLISPYTVLNAAVVAFIGLAALLLGRIERVSPETLIMTLLIAAVVRQVVSFCGLRLLHLGRKSWSAADSAAYRDGCKTELGRDVVHIAECLLIAPYTVTEAAVIGFVPACPLLLGWIEGIPAETLVMTLLVAAVICQVVAF